MKKSQNKQAHHIVFEQPDLTPTDIDPLNDDTPENLPKKVWNRLSDRNKLPRRLWFPQLQRPHVNGDEWQRQHDEVSISLRRTMMALLGYSFFCILTLAAPDASLIAKDAKINVPFAGTEVSYLAFLMIGPLTMFGLVIYLHILLGYWLSLGQNKDTSGLPYIFNIDHKAANWLTNFIFYWLPCLVLAFFSWKALPRPNEAFWLTIQTATFFTCMVVLRIRRFPDNQHRFKFNAIYLFGWLLGVCLLLGTEIGFYERNLDLFGADLSKKDLRNTDLSKAILVEANLDGADLSEADLSGADLSGAILSGTKLSGTKLIGAKLSSLLGIDLRKANLSGVDLRKAKLVRAKLSRAKLRGANLSKTNLSEANLSGADLGRANLSRTNLSKTQLQGADLSEADLSKASLSGAFMMRTDLSGAILMKANLSESMLLQADLSEADLSEASLSTAILIEADLGKAKGLTAKQLCKASALYQAKLGQELEAQIKQECPDLLKEPQKINPDEKSDAPNGLSLSPEFEVAARRIKG